MYAYNIKRSLLKEHKERITTTFLKRRSKIKQAIIFTHIAHCPEKISPIFHGI